MVSYMKARDKGKENMMIVCEKLPVECWHIVYYAVDAIAA